MATGTGTIGAAQAAARLQVKLETIYAYVSRGLLTRLEGSGKLSRFDAAQVERLAARGRGAGKTAPSPLVVESALTAVQDDAIAFRGRDAIELARRARFEGVAEWLWGAAEGAQPSAFEPQPGAVELARTAQAALPRAALPLDRLRVIATVLGIADPLRYELSKSAVLATARALIAGLVESLPRAASKGRERAGARGDEQTIAARLWLRSSGLPPAAARIRALDVAMGLCADHALSPSTLAVRIAASQRADPYAVVQTGMGALSGALHGAASLAAEELLADVERTGDESAVIGARLRRGERIPGFGHALHPQGDPRAAALLAVLAQAFPRSRALDAALAVDRTMRARGLPPANVDFALAALARAAEMVHGSSEAIMAIARVSGWIAHALEEYAAPSVFPWHALYVGPR